MPGGSQGKGLEESCHYHQWDVAIAIRTLEESYGQSRLYLDTNFRSLPPKAPFKDVFIPINIPDVGDQIQVVTCGQTDTSGDLIFAMYTV